MKVNRMKIYLGMAVLGGIVLGAQYALAGTMQGVCSTCHTMHNSQNGQSVTGATTGAYEKLLLNSCIGCHSGATGMLSANDAPIVLHTSEPETLIRGNNANNHLAGGDFYWVQTTDSTGHNVDVVGGQDGDIGLSPPGGYSIATQLRCGDGTGEARIGCHNAGGAHHLNEGGDRTAAGATIWVDGSSNYASYRFLNEASSGFNGVQGGENGDWEFTVGHTDHNVYWSDDDHTAIADDTINSLCGKCHGNFHVTGGAPATGQNVGTKVSSPWYRHPTDTGLAVAGGEYAAYNTYDWIAPVGISTNTTSNTAGGGLATIDTDRDEVLCVSCHRAHGSPNADLLRWSYQLMNSGSGTPLGVGDNERLGCFQCHSTKGGY